MPNTNTYVPGVCNIGPEEIKMRVHAGLGALGIAVLLLAALIGLHLSPILRIFIFLPVFVSSLGFLQAAFHFCVAFGMQGVYNIMNPVGKTESVSQQEFRRQDQKKVVEIFVYAISISLLVTAAVLYI
jgi:archaellum biogenesis protein FlaJ (TadC family)